MVLGPFMNFVESFNLRKKILELRAKKTVPFKKFKKRINGGLNKVSVPGSKN